MISIRKLMNHSKDTPTMDFVFIPPGHGVDGFWMQTTPVTVRQWCTVMRLTCKGEEADLPKTRVNIDDIQQFLQRLNAHTEDEEEFRLPTELEWCYAVGVEPKRLEDYVVYGVGGITPVKTKLPNEYGLYDMRGLVYERVAPNENQYPVWGCAWNSTKMYARAVFRNSNLPVNRDNNVGFRVVLVKE